MIDLIELAEISKIYSGKGIEKTALDAISLSIKQGEFVCITGRSGCGKTTLLNILGCMDTPTLGTYLFDNFDVKKLKGKSLAEFRNKKIGYVFQSFNLLPELNALENVCLPLGYGGMSYKDRKLLGEKSLQQVGLQEYMHHKPGQLSGGQQQRVAIARAIVTAPQIILADEPTGNLDEANGVEIMRILAELHQKGTTLILVTHDNTLANYAKRIIRVVDGKITQ